MHDGFHRTNLATLDGSRWTNPATLDGFTGRILSRSMVSIVQILPSRPGGSRWANLVGQIPLGKVRLMEPTAFTAASVIVISANAL